MAQKQLLTGAGVVTTALAAATLLMGPASTFGLSVGGVDTSSTTSQVTSTTGSVVNTVQQTTSSTVTTVENTVQTTVAAPAPAPAPEPVATPVQTTAPSATPEVAAPRTSTPAPKRTVTVRAPKVSTRQPVAGTQAPRSVAQVAGTATQQVARHVAATTSHVREATKAATVKLAPASSATQGSGPVPALSCDQLLGLIPGSDLTALVSTLCSAGNLVVPARIGTAHAPAPLATVANALAAAVTADRQLLLHARSAGVPRDSARTPVALRRSAGANRAGLPARSVDAAIAAASGGYGAAHAAGFHGVAGGPAIGDAAGRQSGTASAAPTTDGLFGSHVTGTKLLTVFFIADLAVIALIALWRGARRVLIMRTRAQLVAGDWHPLG